MTVVNKSRSKGVVYIQAVAPSSPVDGDSWFDTINNVHKVYSATQAQWILLSVASAA